MIDGDRLPTLETPRGRLRWLTDEDVPDLLAIFSDPEVTRYWSTPPMAGVEEARSLLDEVRTCFAERALFQWGLALEPDDRVVGTCTLAQLDASNRRAEIGFALARQAWGRGLMGEALVTLLDYAFGPLGLRRIEADVDPRNEASIRSLERLGFRQEGLLRERWEVAGEVQDALFFGLLAREWRAGRP